MPGRGQELQKDTGNEGRGSTPSTDNDALRTARQEGQSPTTSDSPAARMKALLAKREKTDTSSPSPPIDSSKPPARETRPALRIETGKSSDTERLRDAITAKSNEYIQYTEKAINKLQDTDDQQVLDEKSQAYHKLNKHIQKRMIQIPNLSQRIQVQEAYIRLQNNHVGEISGPKDYPKDYPKDAIKESMQWLLQEHGNELEKFEETHLPSQGSPSQRYEQMYSQVRQSLKEQFAHYQSGIPEQLESNEEEYSAHHQDIQNSTDSLSSKAKVKYLNIQRQHFREIAELDGKQQSNDEKLIAFDELHKKHIKALKAFKETLPGDAPLDSD